MVSARDVIAAIEVVFCNAFIVSRVQNVDVAWLPQKTFQLHFTLYTTRRT
jgi:hypothetical protein